MEPTSTVIQVRDDEPHIIVAASGYVPTPIVITVGEIDPVLSVNGKIGVVNIDKNDIGLSLVENISIMQVSGALMNQIIHNANQQSFTVHIPQNIEATGISFPLVFAATPSIVEATLEAASGVSYEFFIDNKTTSGFHIDFSDIVCENDIYLNVFASA